MSDAGAKLRGGNACREQGVAAMRDLLDGWVKADPAFAARALGDERRHVVQAGLVTVVLGSVVVFTAEQRGLLSTERQGSLTALHEELSAGRSAEAQGAWPRLAASFDAVHEQGGALFDPAARAAIAAFRPSDDVVFGLLERLRAPDGVPMRYDALDVEEIGGMYEALMGFELAIGEEGARAVDLRPGEVRRKTGSHYTPRSLTRSIVETTLEPLLDRLGAEAPPARILELKVCDPAMGSGAFLLEVCRQLGDRLAGAWERAGMPATHENPVVLARRLVARRCLYGVDKNPLAVDLARVSLWLEVGARDAPLSFVDHALLAGDSLVGLSREAIATFSVDAAERAQSTIAAAAIRAAVDAAVARALELRERLRSIEDPPDAAGVAALLAEVDRALERPRLVGDLLVHALFAENGAKARRKAIDDLATKVEAWIATGRHEAELRGVVAELRGGARPVTPLHWEIEVPEVFREGAA